MPLAAKLRDASKLSKSFKRKASPRATTGIEEASLCFDFRARVLSKIARSFCFFSGTCSQTCVLPGIAAIVG